MISLLVFMLWPMVYTQFNLHDTDRKIENEQLYFDCLYYGGYTELTQWQWLTQ